MKKQCRLLLCLCATAFLGVNPARAQEPAANRPANSGPPRSLPPPADTREFKDVEYVPAGHERQKLDLHVPTGVTNPPLIIWIHGGAWRAGSKDRCPALFLLREGYAVASVNYRLSQHATFPAQIEDCKAAVRWLRAHATEYGIDPEHFGVWGASAGGHLVALLGVTGDINRFDVGQNTNVSSRVQAVCDWFGPADLSHMGDQPSSIEHNAADSPESLLIGGAVPGNPEKASAASPVTYVTADDAPFLIMHGDKDNLVPLDQSKRLQEALANAGVESKLHVVEGGGHGFGGPELQRMVKEFFDSHLKSK